MNNQMFKQSWQLMKENPLVSVVSTLGTALSIAMVLVVVLNWQVDTLGYKPETNRGRTLYVLGTQAASINGNNRNNGGMSYEVVRECFYTLETPEAVTAISSNEKSVSLPSKKMYREYSIKYTDAGFWRIFDFNFLSGEAFSAADFESAIPRVVISSVVARNIFGGEEAVGREVVIDNQSYRVCGVVEEVSRKAFYAYADVWLPFSTLDNFMKSISYCDNICGNFKTVMLARSSSDFDAIREELDKTTAKYNEGKRDANVSFLGGAGSQIEIAAGYNGFNTRKVSQYFLGTGLLLLFMLLVPALNLIGFILSATKKRQTEIGIRKAFGASRRSIVSQIISENLLTSTIGGVIGLGLSFLFFRLYRDYVMTADMLIKPSVFVAAIFFVFLLNLFSAGIPALLSSGKNIVESIKGSSE